MKLEESGPPRLDENDSSELGRLVRAGRSRRMTSAASGRIAERLTAAGAFHGTASSTATKSGLLGRLGSTKLIALALVGLGGAFFVSQSRSYVVSTPPVSVVATQEPVSAPLPVSAPNREPAPTAPTPEREAVSVEALPSPTPPAAPAQPAHVAAARPAPAPHDTTTTPAKAADSEMEFALIRRAQAAVGSEPARALALASEHARTFPAGELAQERELTAVEALAHLGRKEEAKRRAEALLSLFPRTPYVARLEHAIGEPLSPVPPSKTVR